MFSEEVSACTAGGGSEYMIICISNVSPCVNNAKTYVNKVV